MKNHYIEALLELVQNNTDPETIFTGLKRTMESKGHMRLYTRVLRGLLRILESRKDETNTSVAVAKEADLQKYASTIKQALSALHADENFSTKVDESIIGGVTIKNNNTVVDKSYKTALVKLYRSITA